MQRFNPEIYYHIGQDQKILSGENKVIEPTFEGARLIAKYYAGKYGSMIIVMNKADIKNISLEPGPNLKFELTGASAAAVPIYFSMEKVKDKNVHTTYVIYDNFHTTSLTYIRQNGEEAFLISDSRTSNNFEARALKMMFPDMNIFTIAAPRQSDAHSCHVDALIWGRVITAKDRNRNYELSNFLTFLKQHSHEDQGIMIVDKLPPELLITAQLERFVDDHTTKSDKPIHKGKPLSLFRKDYMTKAEYLKKDNTTKTGEISSYLRKKGIKLSNVIEIEYYLRELQKELKELGVDLDYDMRLDFIAAAKKLIKNKPNESLYDLACDYIAKYKNSNIPKP